MQIHEITIILINLLLIGFSYLWLYPRIAADNLQRITAGDIIVSITSLLVGAIFYWESGLIFSFYFFETDWFWYVFGTFVMIEFPFFIWYGTTNHMWQDYFNWDMNTEMMIDSLVEEELDLDKEYTFVCYIKFDKWPLTKEELDRVLIIYPSFELEEELEKTGLIYVNDVIDYELIKAFKKQLKEDLSFVKAHCSSWELARYIGDKAFFYTQSENSFIDDDKKTFLDKTLSNKENIIYENTQVELVYRTVLLFLGSCDINLNTEYSKGEYGLDIILLTNEDKNKYLHKLQRNLYHENELNEFYNDINNAEEETIGEDMIEVIEILHDKLKNISSEEVIVIVIDEIQWIYI